MVTESVKYKILLLGDGAVGKTSLIRRFVVDQFDDQYIATIGAKVMKKDLRIFIGVGTYDVTLIIWDVLGQKGFHGVQTSAFEQSKGVILVLDLTRPETLESIKDYWIPRVKELVGIVPMMLFGNKVDLVDYRPPTESKVADLAKQVGCKYFLTSAKTGENVEEGFSSFARTLMEKAERQDAGATTSQEAAAKEATIATVADWIMTDFCEGFGGIETGTPILNEQFKRAEVDINRPSKDGLLKVVDLLAIVETSFKSEKEVEESRAKRVGWVNGLKSS